MGRRLMRLGLFVGVLAAGGAVAVAIEQARRQQAPAGGTPPVPRPAPEPALHSSRSEPEPAEPAPVATVDFYNQRTRSTIPVPADKVRKRRVVRTGDNGTRQERYAVAAEIELDGRQLRLFKFVSRDQFDALDVPEES